MTSGTRWTAFAWILAASLACAGPGFDYADLPEAPISLVYRTREESERVAEMTRRAAEPAGQIIPGQHHIHLEDVGSVIGVGTTPRDRAAGLLGRLAFLDPRSREIRVGEFASRGDRPLAWSPDHSRLLYLTLRRGVPHVSEYASDTGEVVPVTHGSRYDHDACYGPDGRIAFARSTPLRPGGGGVRIFVREPGGGPPRPLTPGPADGAPTWSPDGTLLVYETVDEQGSAAIASIDPAGGGEPRLLTRGRTPVFTPDGQWIVYSAHTREGWKLWKMRADGGGKRRLGRSPHDELDPTVSPDGAFVAFVSVEGDRPRLRVRSIDGSGDRPLLKEGDGLRPAW